MGEEKLKKKEKELRAESTLNTGPENKSSLPHSSLQLPMSIGCISKAEI